MLTELGDADSASEEHLGRGVPVDPLGFGGRKRCWFWRAIVVHGY